VTYVPAARRFLETYLACRRTRTPAPARPPAPAFIPSFVVLFDDRGMVPTLMKARGACS
jgi:hypothetical protein